MGNILKNDNNKLNIKSILKHYNKNNKIYHKNYEDIIFMYDKNNSNDQIIIKDIIISDLTENNKISSIINHNFSSKNILKIKHFKKITEEHNCLTFYKYLIIFEFSNFTLKDELNRLKKINNILKENEILYIIKSILLALNEIHSIGIYHGDIQPSTIHVVNNGNIKLANNYLLTKSKSNYNKSLNSNTIYKAAYSYDSLKILKGKNYININKYKEDIFSLGITTILIILNEDLEYIYNYNELKIKNNILLNSLKIIESNNISDKILILIQDCIEKDYNYRLSARQLLNKYFY